MLTSARIAVSWVTRVAADICRACGSRELELKERVTNERQQLELWRCRGCGSFSYFPEPSIDYTGHTDDLLSVKRYLEINAACDWMAVNVMTAIGERRSGRLLDIGCGFGFSADAARRLAGWSVLGVEPSHWGLLGAKALRLEILNEFIDARHPVAQERFDIVHASEVIEHIGEPVNFLRFLAGLLVPGGVLVLTTPDAAALDGPLSDSMRHAILSVGAHVMLFTKSALTDALARAGLVHFEVGVRGTTLVAFASDRPLRLKPADPLPLGIAYAEAILSSDLAEPALLDGQRFRLFRHRVELGQFDAAERQIGELGRAIMPLSGSPASLADYAKEHRLYTGVLCFYAGILRLVHQGDVSGARELFAWSQAHCECLLGLTPGDSVFEQNILWRARFHEGMCSGLLGDAAAARAIDRDILEADRATPGAVPADIVERARAAL